MAESTAQLISKAKEANLSLNSRLGLKLWLDEYGTKRALPVELSNVAKFELKESMFLKLPVGQFLFYDNGESREQNRFYTGRLLYIGFEYTPADAKITQKNISKGRYKIVGTKIRSTGKGQMEYLVNFVYDAMALFSKYPVVQSRTGTQRSTEVMAEIAAEVGLEGLSTDVDTSDEQIWFNPGMSAYDFLKHVIAHSYINDRDFGMFWVGKDGKSRFSGMRENMQNGLPYFFDSEYNKNMQERTKHVIFSDVYQEDLGSKTIDELKAKYDNKSFILMSGSQRNNDGWAADMFSGSEEIGVYDPMLRSLLLGTDDVSFDGLYHLTHEVGYKQIAHGTLATDLTKSNGVSRRTFAGYTFWDLHPAWDIAPARNRIMRSEFFSNRYTLMINCGQQMPCFGEQDLRIGDVLDVDYSTAQGIGGNGTSTIDNGRAVVHSIDWIFVRNSSMMIRARVATDAIHPTTRGPNPEEIK